MKGTACWRVVEPPEDQASRSCRPVLEAPSALREPGQQVDRHRGGLLRPEEHVGRDGPLTSLLAEVTDVMPAGEGLDHPALLLVVDPCQFGVEPAQVGGQVLVPARKGTVLHEQSPKILDHFRALLLFPWVPGEVRSTETPSTPALLHR